MKIEGITVHDKKDCQLPCPFHGPSDHPLKDAPMHLRVDKGCLVERICEHGVGHDDPDSVAYMHAHGYKWVAVHGCDGCCQPPEREAGVAEINFGTQAKAAHDPIPPDGCNCASFWTIRGTHKTDCPLAKVASDEAPTCSRKDCGNAASNYYLIGVGHICQRHADEWLERESKSDSTNEAACLHDGQHHATRDCPCQTAHKPSFAEQERRLEEILSSRIDATSKVQLIIMLGFDPEVADEIVERYEQVWSARREGFSHAVDLTEMQNDA